MTFKAYETSSAQKRLYTINHLQGDSILYNETRVWSLMGKLDPVRLGNTVKKISNRHETLRTCFVMKDGVVLQKVYDHIEVDFKYTDLQMNAAGTSPGDIEKIIDGFLKPYELGKVPLWKIEMVQLQQKQQLLLFDFHHIIADGTSMDVIMEELIALYLGKELPMPEVQYVDFTTWQNDLFKGEMIKNQEAYWLKVFEDKIPVLDLPSDYPRPLQAEIAGASIEFEMGDALTAGVKRLALQHNITLYVVMLAVFNVLLSKYSSQEDIVVGSPISGRTHREFENMVGMFVNTLAIRNKPAAKRTFRDFLSAVSANALAAFENQYYQFEMLVEKVVPRRQLNRNPLFDVMFALQNYARPIDISLLGNEVGVLTPFHFKSRTAKFDLTLQAFEVDWHILFRLEYKTSLFRRDSIERLTGHFLNIFRQVTENCQLRLGQIRLISEAEQRHLLYELNNTSAPYSRDKTIQQLFEEQVKRTPDNIAAAQPPQMKYRSYRIYMTYISYGELNRKSNQLAHFLRIRGVKPDTIVGILVEPSLDMIIGILAILKAGGAYLPIDTTYPVERVLLVLKDSRAPFLLTHTGILENHSYTTLRNLQASGIEPHITGLRDQGDFDSFPHPDRSLIDYKKFSSYIGHAMVKKAISIQGTRGCPYNCAYCHRTMLKKNVARSAENIFEEVRFYYERGVRRFSFVDEIFNLNVENSQRFFHLILKNKMEVQLFFPNGMRADRMTRDYVDLMVEAGTVNLGLALETASPRLQKLIKKNLNIDKLRDIGGYFCSQYPGVILELFTMHGFPTETEEEALQTLNFIKSLKWVHFPYVFLLKIHPSTDMMKLALDSGISRETIERSMTAAFHEIPETLPFPKSFTRQYVARFMKEYFLCKERLLYVLPYQLKVASKDELARKYDNYLPAPIRTFPDILENAGISASELGELEFVRPDTDFIPDYAAIAKKRYPYSRPYPFSSTSSPGPDTDTFRILLLDLSVLFSTEKKDILHGEITEPLGLIYLLTYLNKTFANKIAGRMYKSQIDFDSYEQLKPLVCDFQPHLIGIRTLSYFKDFFHRTAARIREWGINAPIIAGGPYGTSDYKLVLQDPAVALTVLREGELTLTELVGKMMANNNKLPPEEVLRQIPGIAFIKEEDKKHLENRNREIFFMDKRSHLTARYPVKNPVNLNRPDHLLYLISTSGSTGQPKGVMLEHRNMVNLLNYEFSCTGVRFDKVLQFASIGFDISAQEIFSTLLSGGQLYLIDRETKHNLPGLFAYIETNGISVLFLPPIFLKLVFEDHEYAELFPWTVKHIIAAGEKLVVPERLNTYLTGNGVFLHNHYGPAETHVVTALTMPPPDIKPQCPSIGTPVSNTRVLIMNENLDLEPLGVVGEIYITGANVGRGYCNRPVETSGKYIDNPYVKGERMYRSGDLGRWLANGEIEFLGRKDHQVKIRGFRIELAEVETHLKNIDFIKDAVVLDNETSGGEKYLTAYLVLKAAGNPDKTEELAELRDMLARTLPDYMIPAYFTIIEQVPLNPSGKIDKKALLNLGPGGHPRLYRGAENRLQRELLEIWAEVLKKEKNIISIDENFFETGGHSLSGAILIAKIQKKHHVRVPLGELFKRPTVQGLAEYILDVGKSFSEYDMIRPGEKRAYYPQSSTQKRLFFLDQLENIGTSYNMPAFFKIGRSLDRERILEVIPAMLQRHEGLRTSFHMKEGTPVQIVHDKVELGIEYYDLQVTGAGSRWRRGEPAAHSPQPVLALISSFIRPFQLGQPPLLRIGFISLAGEESLLLFDMHHIITDGTSMGIFLKDFMALLEGVELSPLNLQYKDFSQWQTKERVKKLMKSQGEYWLRIFAGEVPVLNLPLDYARPAIQHFQGNRIEFRLDAGIAGRLRSLARQQDATLYMVTLAVFNVLLFKLSGQEDITVGTPVAARRHADLEKIMGMFVNTLAMRNFPQAEQGFGDFLRNLRGRTLDAFENQEYPFEDLVELLSIPRDMSRNPVFDVMFALHNQNEPWIGFPGPLPFKDIEPYEYKLQVANFDLELHGNEVGDCIDFILVYSSQLFKKQTIERYVKYFTRIVETVIKNPGQMLSAMDILSQEEKNQILFQFNQEAAAIPRENTIQRLFAEQAQKKPHHIAAVAPPLTGNRTYMTDMTYISYRELDKRSNGWVRLLIEKGVRADTIVGIMVERGLEMLFGLLAILKAGGAYLPIDPHYPEERIKYMLADSGAKVLLAASDLASAFEPPPSPLTCQVSPTSLAYVIYTSGSTGVPRGVLVEHENLLRLITGQNFIDFSKADRLLLTGAIGFDITVFEIWFPLLNGLTLFLADRDTILDAEKLGPFIVRNRISLLHLIPQLFDRLAGVAPGIFKSLSYLLVGGDVVRPYYVNIVRSRNKNLKVLHMYGPTENTVFSTFFPVEADHPNTIPIGKPLRHSSIHILDKSGRLQPIGIVGEIFTGGKGVARGYLNNTELTAEKFDQEENNKKFLQGGPGGAVFSKSAPPGRRRQKIYKTGDLGRWLPEGDIEFIGRIDNQVKIRGIRIELGEIEIQLLTHPGIREAAVIDWSEKTGEKYLCAYIVSGRDIEDVEIREYISRKVPNVMIPGYFIKVDRIPVTPNGKVDRKALPEPGLKVFTQYAAPRHEIEERLVEIWQEVLGLTGDDASTGVSLGIDDNFFQLGGHSLRAAALTAKVHKELNVKLPLEVIFSTPTIRGLWEYIKHAQSDKFSGIGPVEKKDYYVLSSAQQRLFVLQHMDPDASVYNMPFVIPLDWKPGPEELEEIFNQLIDRHESLRTSFSIVNEAPVQRVDSKVDFSLEYYDLRVAGALIHGDRYRRENEETGGLAPLLKDFIRPFDLSQSPLLRVGLITLPHPLAPGRGSPSQEGKEHKYILIVDMHHIIADGMSLQLLVRDFRMLYHGKTLSPLRICYKDFSEWQKAGKETKEFKRQGAYWLRRFAGEIPVPALPTDFPRPAVRSFAGTQVMFELSNDAVYHLKSIASAQGATLFMVLSALFSIFLSKLTGQEDILVGTAAAGRKHIHLEQVVGMFVNTLVMRNYPNKEKTFNWFLQDVKKNTLQDFENQEYPFEDLVDKVVVSRDTSRNPLFDVMFVMQNIAPESMPVELAGTAAPRQTRDRYENLNRVSRFDMTLTAVEADRELFFEIEYCSALFKKETIERFIAYFKKIAASVVENPQQKISGIEIITAEEKKKLLYDFNDTGHEWGEARNKTLHELFEEQAAITPDNIAVIGPQQRKYRSYRTYMTYISYQELNRESKQLARILHEKGVERDTILAIVVERSIEMIIGILAILKSGGAYLPIEPGYPEERIKYMLKDSGAWIQLTLSNNSSWSFSTPKACKNCPKSTASHLHLPPAPVTSLAYVIYTSGTTGQPKGVMVNHHSAVNTLLCRKEEYKIKPGDVSLQLFSYAFDGFVTSFFTPVISGAAVILTGKDEVKDIIAIRDTIVKNNVTHFISIPALYQGIIQVLTREEAAGLRVVTLAGDSFQHGLLEMTKEKNPGLEIANEYGVTECSVMSTIHRHQERSSSIRIGQPIWNTRLYILDRCQNLQPIGIPGELSIAGAGVARGYLNNPELTVQRFLPVSARFYRSNMSHMSYIPHMSYIYQTGDLAKWLPDGSIEFLGRLDQQIKIRGFRIEIEEIETQLLKQHLIKEAVVKAVTEEKDEQYLCAYVVPKKEVCGTDIKDFLSRSLPGYMVPAYFVFLDALPLTPNGKVDKKVLPTPGFKAGEASAAPRNKIEKKLVEMWSQLFNLPSISIDDDFFRLGGHSLKAALLTAKIHQQLNVKVPLAQLFKTPFIRGLAQYILAAERDRYEFIKNAEKMEYYPLSMAQQGIFAQQQQNPDMTAYNMPQTVPLHVDIDKEQLEIIFKKLIRRHESLRTSFHMTDKRPVQRIHDQVEFKIEYYDISKKGEMVPDSFIKDFIRPFDLTRAPLLRVGLMGLPHTPAALDGHPSGILPTPSALRSHPSQEGRSILMVDMHHIITDGVSGEIFSNEIIALYNNIKLPTLRIQYKDYAIWQNSSSQKEKIKKQGAYWLKTFEEKIPQLNLPVDYERLAAKRYEGDHASIPVENKLASQLYHLAEQSQTTLYMLLLAVYFVMLSKYANQEDIVVGSPVTGRRHADLQGIIGMFVNMLAIRSHPKGDTTFKTFLTEVKTTVIGCQENQDYHFQELVRELGLHSNPGVNPLFEVVFVWENSEADHNGPEWQEYTPTSIEARFELLVHAVEVKPGSQIQINFDYAAALFKRSTIETMAEHFKEILTQVVEDEDIRLGDILLSHQLTAAGTGIIEGDQKEFAFE